MKYPNDIQKIESVDEIETNYYCVYEGNAASREQVDLNKIHHEFYKL